jgi:ribonuclease P protein component
VPSQHSAQFCKNCRLLKPSEFKHVFDQPNKASTFSFLTFSRENQSTHSRVGLAISKKNAKRAVDRNRIKRLIRENFRLNKQKLPPVDIVILAKRGILEQDNEALQKQLYGLWKKLARQYGA